MKIIKYAALLATLGIAACASSSEEIAAQYVSPETYSSYNCTQLQQEAARVSNRASAALGRQNEAASNDAATTAAALILFWPAAFFLNGDDETANEVSRLKGEMEAIEQASIMKNCGITFSQA